MWHIVLLPLAIGDHRRAARRARPSTRRGAAAGRRALKRGDVMTVAAPTARAPLADSGPAQLPDALLRPGQGVHDRAGGHDRLCPWCSRRCSRRRTTPPITHGRLGEGRLRATWSRRRRASWPARRPAPRTVRPTTTPAEGQSVLGLKLQKWGGARLALSSADLVLQPLQRGLAGTRPDCGARRVAGDVAGGPHRGRDGVRRRPGPGARRRPSAGRAPVAYGPVPELADGLPAAWPARGVSRAR